MSQQLRWVNCVSTSAGPAGNSVTGSGTPNRLTKWNTSSSLGNARIEERPNGMWGFYDKNGRLLMEMGIPQ